MIEKKDFEQVSEKQTKRIETLIERKVEKYFKELINYNSVQAQLLNRMFQQNQTLIKLIQDILNKDSKEALNGNTRWNKFRNCFKRNSN